MKKTLYTVLKGHKYTIKSMPKVDALESIGVFPGVMVNKEAMYKFGGPVYVTLGSRQIAIGKGVAADIIVEEVL